MKKLTFLLFALLPIITNAQKSDHTWSVVLSSGFSDTKFGTAENLRDTTNSLIYNDHREYFFFRPSIRLNGEKHFAGFTLDEFKFGTKYMFSLRNLMIKVDYSSFGFNFSFNSKILSSERFQFVLGEAIGFKRTRHAGLPIYGLLLDQLDLSAYFQGILRCRYQISNKFVAEISSLIRLVEGKLRREVWEPEKLSILPYEYEYSGFSYMNGAQLQLSLEYEF